MKIIITGGAGFIGCNAAAYFCKRGYQIVLIDNLSRRGSRWNLDRLKSMWNPRFEHVDICDVPALDACLAAHKDAGGVLHLAAQTAVTT